MKVLRAFRLSALLALCAAPGFGQSADEALFDSPDAGVATESASSTADVTGKLLGSDQKTVLFGEFHAQATALWADSDPALSQSLSLDLGLTARPDKDLRIGAKGTWTFDPASATGDFHVSEAFADFQGGDFAYFRVGKQFISWGKGLYYSPADVLSLSSINATNTMDPTYTGPAREGPTSLKASLETGATGTYQAVISTEGATQGSDVKFSGAGTWLLAGAELSVGGFYQPSHDMSPRLFATTVFKLFDLNCYTESVLLWGNDQKRLADDGNGGLVVVANDGSLLTQQTIGFSYSKDDAEKRWTLNATGQYYFNGTGASVPSLYRDRPFALMALLRQGELAAGDLRGYGSHYVAGTLGLSKIGGSTFSLACSALASLSEGSWRASPRLSWVVSPDLTLGAAAGWCGGPSGSEYAPLGKVAAWQADAKIFRHLFVALSGPLPGSEAGIDPQLRVTLEGFGF